MAAVAPQPVIVDYPAGAPTSGSPIFLAANSEVVSSTPCLDWQPAPAGLGGAARVQLMTFQAVKAFLPRCKISRIAADLAAANAVNAMTVRLTDAGWSRSRETALQGARLRLSRAYLAAGGDARHARGVARPTFDPPPPAAVDGGVDGHRRARGGRPRLAPVPLGSRADGVMEQRVQVTRALAESADAVPTHRGVLQQALEDGSRVGVAHAGMVARVEGTRMPQVAAVHQVGARVRALRRRGLESRAPACSGSGTCG